MIVVFFIVSPSLSLVAASMSLSLVVVVPMSPLLHCRRSSSCLPLVVLYVARCSVAVVFVAISPSLVVLLVVASSLPSSPYRRCLRVAASSLSSSLDVLFVARRHRRNTAVVFALQHRCCLCRLSSSSLLSPLLATLL